MISTKIEKRAATVDYILSKIDDYNLFKKYIGNFTIGQVMKSPLRKDRHPSFSIFFSTRYQKLIFKDYGTGESGDIFEFLQKLFKLNFNETLKQIIEDLNLEKVRKPIKTEYSKDAKYFTKIGIVRQNFTEQDKLFWDSFYITEKTLKKYKVDSISHYLVNGIVKGVYKEGQPMFAYSIFDKKKIYRPLSDKSLKWRGNTTTYDLQGYEQLPKTIDTLIITKSLKDVMVLYEMGFPAIAPPSETCEIPKEVIETLKTKANRLFLLFDRDATGLKNTRKLFKQYNIPFSFINKKYKCKDISDFVKLYGTEKGKEIIKGMLKR